MKRKLRYGMIGGGRGAFIGAVHRIAAAMDGQAELVAGTFSSDPARSRASGADLLIDPARVYPDYHSMAAAEGARERGDRLDFVVIVTPNHEHYAPARLFLESGFHVILDKPATFDLPQARRLRQVVRNTGRLLVLTHNYSGHAMIRQARHLVRSGELGELRKIVVDYPQGWLSSALERAGQKQAAWRTDPRRSGAAGCMGDIGTHAEHLARYVTGLQLESLCADLTTFVKGRRLDDDGSVLLRYRGGARGILHASQVCLGEENALSLRVYGTRASLAWRQERPDELVVLRADSPRELQRRGNAYLCPQARAAARIPAGHPEGYLEAFANLYLEAFRGIRALAAGKPLPRDLDVPTIDDGVAGMAFIEAVVKSSRGGARWVRMPAT